MHSLRVIGTNASFFSARHILSRRSLYFRILRGSSHHLFKGRLPWVKVRDRLFRAPLAGDRLFKGPSLETSLI